MTARVRVSARRSRRMQPPEHGVGAGIGLLALHAPVFELFEGNRAAGDGATHERARPDHPEVAVQVLHLRFARRGRIWIEAIEQALPVERSELWSEGEENFEARLDAILARR